MKLLRALVLSALFFQYSPAFPITQIGGGKVADRSSGFEAPLTQPFRFSTPDGHNGLTLFSDSPTRGHLPPLGFAPTNLRPLDVVFPQLSHMSRNEVEMFFANYSGLKFHHYIHSKDACIDIYSAQSRTETVVVAAWGPTRGVVFGTSTDFDLREAIFDMVDGITLNPGACQWP